MKKLFVASILLLIALSVQGQNANAFSFEAGEKGLIALGNYLLEADISERQRLTYLLLPRRSEYELVFRKEKIRQIQKYHRKWYRKVSPAIGPNNELQQVVLCEAATPAEILQELGEGKNFPGGYREIADWFLPDITLYRMKYVEKGMRVGSSFDVFVYLEDHWRVFPKPWRANQD